MVMTGVVMVTVMVMARREGGHRDHDHCHKKQRQKLFHGRDYKEEISCRKPRTANGTMFANEKMRPRR
jgi:hypothetical protein